MTNGTLAWLALAVNITKLLNYSYGKSEFECTNYDIRGTKFRVRRLRRSVAKPRFSVAAVFNGAPIFYLSEPEVPFARCRGLPARSG